MGGKGGHVRCTHPGLTCVVGDENVQESWKIVFQSVEVTEAERSYSGKKVDIRHIKVYVYANGNMGIVTCEEALDGHVDGVLSCTNVFEKQNGEWKMIQHHTSLITVLLKQGGASSPQ